MKTEELQMLLSLKKEAAELESAKRKIEGQTAEGAAGNVRASAKSTPYMAKLRKAEGFSGDAENRRMQTIGGIERMLAAKAAQLEPLEKKTLEYIESVEDERIKLILRLRYVDGYKWEKVGELMGYERTYVIKLLRSHFKKRGG